MAKGYGCFAGVPEVLEELRKLYAAAAERDVAEARRKIGLADEPSSGYAKLYAEALAGRGARVSTLESTVNLRQNELRALIANYAEEVRMLISQRTSFGEERHDLCRSAELTKSIRERVVRMHNLVDELEP